jgi:MFS family permease
MTSIASTPGAFRLFALSIVARLPMPMLGLGLLVHAEHLTDSFTAAGIVSGAYAVSVGIGGPLLGQLVDRRGQTAALLASALAAAAVLGALAMLPAGAPVPAIAALAAALGLATPPSARACAPCCRACCRTRARFAPPTRRRRRRWS